MGKFHNPPFLVPILVLGLRTYNLTVFFKKAWAYALVEGNIQNYNGFSGHQDNTKVVIIERMVLQNLALFEI